MHRCYRVLNQPSIDAVDIIFFRSFALALNSSNCLIFCPAFDFIDIKQSFDSEIRWARDAKRKKKKLRSLLFEFWDDLQFTAIAQTLNIFIRLALLFHYLLCLFIVVYMPICKRTGLSIFDRDTNTHARPHSIKIVETAAFRKSFNSMRYLLVNWWFLSLSFAVASVSVLNFVYNLSYRFKFCSAIR